MTMATSHALSTSSYLLCTPLIINVSICNHLLLFHSPFSGRAHQALTIIWGLIQSEDETTASFLMLDPDQFFGRDSISANILATDLGYETSSLWPPKDSHEVQFPYLTSPKPVDILQRPLDGESSREHPSTSNSRLALDGGEMIDYSETKFLENYNFLDMGLGGNHRQGSSIVVRSPLDFEGLAAAVGAHTVQMEQVQATKLHRDPL